jgi:hypothetical protein
MRSGRRRKGRALESPVLAAMHHDRQVVGDVDRCGGSGSRLI